MAPRPQKAPAPKAVEKRKSVAKRPTSKTPKAPKAKPAAKAPNAAKDPKTPTFKSSGVRPTAAPLFGPTTKDLFGYWHGKWYEVEVLRPPTDHERGHHVYLIRWTKDPNLAKPGEWATNESFYPEDWIFTKADIPPHQLPGAEKKKAKPPASPNSKATATAGVQNAPRTGPGFGFGVFQASATQPATHKYPYKWQYFDDKRASRGKDVGWHDYDLSGSDVVEEAYQSWVTDPYIDVRAVHSGKFNYTVDFNQMQQTNVDHAAHTVRALRRVRVSDGSDAMDEQRAIRRQVSLQRLGDQSDSIADAAAASSSSAPRGQSAPLQRVPSQRTGNGTGDGAAASSPSSPGAIGAEDLVRVPSGRSGMVLTTTGGPSLPVQVRFPDGATEFLEAADVRRE
eukprot:TRINITY_DN480_c0_g1_i1.p1 TRINITY_DN480_c0_g1~~TRINITY_DN480_c0_g1_i1.p1  ORF type:complete len:410 (+),score=103.77 TRINITY_DN480_c0_g1_i1:48-1232(+)